MEGVEQILAGARRELYRRRGWRWSKHVYCSTQSCWHGAAVVVVVVVVVSNPNKYKSTIMTNTQQEKSYHEKKIIPTSKLNEIRNEMKLQLYLNFMPQKIKTNPSLREESNPISQLVVVATFGLGLGPRPLNCACCFVEVNQKIDTTVSEEYRSSSFTV